MALRKPIKRPLSPPKIPLTTNVRGGGGGGGGSGSGGAVDSEIGRAHV